MTLPPNKTKIVCTIGPASESPEVMEEMIIAGMNVARLNLSHGDFASHKKVIENLRAAARALGPLTGGEKTPECPCRSGQNYQRGRQARKKT